MPPPNQRGVRGDSHIILHFYEVNNIRRAKGVRSKKVKAKQCVGENNRNKKGKRKVKQVRTRVKQVKLHSLTKAIV